MVSPDLGYVGVFSTQYDENGDKDIYDDAGNGTSDGSKQFCPCRVFVDNINGRTNLTESEAFEGSDRPTNRATRRGREGQGFVTRKSPFDGRNGAFGFRGCGKGNVNSLLSVGFEVEGDSTIL
jgi:hypothetical protein